MVGNKDVISKEWIKPSSSTPHASRDLKLSFLDQIAPSTFVPLILFYQNESLFSSSMDHANRSQHLKQSLSEVLTKFYPLAGRINGNLSVDCNDSGALFIEARIHAPLSRAIQNTTTEDSDQYLPLEFDCYASNYSLPLAVQISFFECGGIAVGVCISHKLVDGMSFVTFMDAWAATCRGKADKIVQPNFELGGSHFPPTNFQLPALCNFTPSGERGTFVAKRFVFNKERLAALKQAASSGSSVKDPTSVEAVSAFIWKHFISAAKANVDRKKDFLAFHIVNLRQRMSLPCDRFAFGNFVTGAIALLTSSDQDDHDEEYFDDLVGHLRTAIRKIDHDYIKQVQSGLPFLNSLQNIALEQLDCSSFSSWCGFRIYEVDFGWGKPSSVSPGLIPARNSVMLLSASCGDGIEAWITTEKDEMAVLPDELLSLSSLDH